MSPRRSATIHPLVLGAERDMQRRQLQREKIRKESESQRQALERQLKEQERIENSFKVEDKVYLNEEIQTEQSLFDPSSPYYVNAIEFPSLIPEEIDESDA